MSFILSVFFSLILAFIFLWIGSIFFFYFFFFYFFNFLQNFSLIWICFWSEFWPISMFFFSLLPALFFFRWLFCDLFSFLVQSKLSAQLYPIHFLASTLTFELNILSLVRVIRTEDVRTSVNFPKTFVLMLPK